MENELITQVKQNISDTIALVRGELERLMRIALDNNKDNFDAIEIEFGIVWLFKDGDFITDKFIDMNGDTKAIKILVDQLDDIGNGLFEELFIRLDNKQIPD